MKSCCCCLAVVVAAFVTVDVYAIKNVIVPLNSCFVVVAFFVTGKTAFPVLG